MTEPKAVTVSNCQMCPLLHWQDENGLYRCRYPTAMTFEDMRDAVERGDAQWWGIERHTIGHLDGRARRSDFKSAPRIRSSRHPHAIVELADVDRGSSIRFEGVNTYDEIHPQCPMRTAPALLSIAD